jgi:hypothetical protein
MHSGGIYEMNRNTKLEAAAARLIVAADESGSRLRLSMARSFGKSA